MGTTYIYLGTTYIYNICRYKSTILKVFYMPLSDFMSTSALQDTTSFTRCSMAPFINPLRTATTTQKKKSTLIPRSSVSENVRPVLKGGLHTKGVTKRHVKTKVKKTNSAPSELVKEIDCSTLN